MGSLSFFLGKLLDVFTALLIIHIILSWATMFSRSYQVRRAYWWTSRLVEPFLAPFRQLLAPYMPNLGLDISPLILFLLIGILRSILRL